MAIQVKRGTKKTLYLMPQHVRALKSCEPWIVKGAAEGVRVGMSSVVQWAIDQAEKARRKGLSPKDVERLIENA